MSSITKSDIHTEYIFFDGSCKNNGKPNSQILSGFYIHSLNKVFIQKPTINHLLLKLTSQSSELYAFFLFLNYLSSNSSQFPPNTHFKLIFDSQYTISVYTQFIQNWINQSPHSIKSHAHIDLILATFNLLQSLQSSFSFSFFHFPSHTPLSSHSDPYTIFLWHGNNIIDQTLSQYWKKF